MKTVILDAATLGNDIDLSPITAFHETIVYQSTNFDEVEERIKDCEAVIINKIKLNESNLKNAKKLKLICVTATGYDNIDIEYCKSNSISVYNIIGYSTDSVAQVTVGMVLNLVNKLDEYTRHVKSGEYTKIGKANCLEPVYYELSGKIWGIVGAGNIGKQVARVAKVFGCKVVVFKRTPDTEFETVSLEELCRASDIITLHLPHNSATDRIINAQMIEKMKKGVIIVNTARGKVIDEEAVLEGLKSGKIGGFGSDVYPVEPFDEQSVYNTLKDMKNVCLTPHMAWGSFEARTRCVDSVASNMQAFLHNKPSENKIV